MSFWDDLRPASWRGIPFGVLAESADQSRAVAVHTYPKRETVWVEDLGAGKNPISITGFLVGDDVIDQRAAMEEAMGQPGPGELVHPFYGARTVVLVESSTATRADLGRVVEIQLVFIESGERLYPTTAIATQQAVAAAAAAADAAASGDFASQIGAAAKTGAVAVQQAAATAKAWAAQANGLVADAAVALHAVGSLTGLSTTRGAFGRFFRGARSVIGGTVSVTGSVNGLINRASAARAAVGRAATNVATLAGRL